MNTEELDLTFAIRINETDTPLTQAQRNYISDVGEHAMALRRRLASAERERDEARVALGWMVKQYMEFSEGYVSHEFMSAQEDAIDHLEAIGWLTAGEYERYYWTAAARAALEGTRES